MAKAELNPILDRLRGEVGDLVFKQYGNRTVVSKKPDLSNHVATPAQRAQRDRFRRAMAYARQAMADPAAREVYRELARPERKPPHSLAVGDFLNRPTVDRIYAGGYDGRAGGQIAVTAHDDVGVVAVEVTLATEGGGVIEEGSAAESPPGSGRWVYAATADPPPGVRVRVTARAKDRPGNVAEASQLT